MHYWLDEFVISMVGFGDNRTINPPINTSIKPNSNNINPVIPNKTDSRNMN